MIKFGENREVPPEVLQLKEVEKPIRIALITVSYSLLK